MGWAGIFRGLSAIELTHLGINSAQINGCPRLGVVDRELMANGEEGMIFRCSAAELT